MRVVVGYDGSDSAKRALQRVADFAGDGQIVIALKAHDRVMRLRPHEAIHLDWTIGRFREGPLDGREERIGCGRRLLSRGRLWLL